MSRAQTETAASASSFSHARRYRGSHSRIGTWEAILCMNRSHTLEAGLESPGGDESASATADRTVAAPSPRESAVDVPPPSREDPDVQAREKAAETLVGTVVGTVVAA